jgi:hypothetical protein
MLRTDQQVMNWKDIWAVELLREGAPSIIYECPANEIISMLTEVQEDMRSRTDDYTVVLKCHDHVYGGTMNYPLSTRDFRRQLTCWRKEIQ